MGGKGKRYFILVNIYIWKAEMKSPEGLVTCRDRGGYAESNKERGSISPVVPFGALICRRDRFAMYQVPILPLYLASLVTSFVELQHPVDSEQPLRNSKNSPT